MASDALSSPYKTFSLLNNADLKFPEVKDSKGGSHALTHGSYIKLMESADRELRRNAFGGLYSRYGEFRNTFASILDATVKTHVLDAKARKHKSALAAALQPDRIPEKVYSSLIETVRERLPAIHSYYALRAKKLGLEKLDMFDVYNPLLHDSAMEVPWTRARDWVLEAMRPLGDEYGRVLKSAFDERWIDYLECKGKKSAPYSSGCYGRPPYILMNYAGNLDGVFPLAHELGHSLHSHFSDSAQPFHYASYGIFVAEVASTTNELLLHKLLFDRAGSKDMKAHLLNHLADELRGTLFRQTMFAEFEKTIHEMAVEGEPLTADSLCRRYYDLNAAYHGPAVAPDKRIELEWARIPHFHYDFYVFKYATGISAAVKLSKMILAGETKPDLRFLRAGGSKDVIDIMKDAGVDFSTPAPVEAAIELFKETVAELDANL
jgi:oligoendopeptidase F